MRAFFICICVFVYDYLSIYLWKETSNLHSLIGVILNPVSAYVGRESASADGIHYTDEVYQVIVQMMSNAYVMRFPALYAVSTGKIDTSAGR